MPRSKEKSAVFFALAFSRADLESEFRAHAKPAVRALTEPAVRAAPDPGRIKFAGADCESRAGRFSCAARAA
jgi:hypothetical protein